MALRRAGDSLSLPRAGTPQCRDVASKGGSDHKSDHDQRLRIHDNRSPSPSFYCALDAQDPSFHDYATISIRGPRESRSGHHVARFREDRTGSVAVLELLSECVLSASQLTIRAVDRIMRTPSKRPAMLLTRSRDAES